MNNVDFVWCPLLETQAAVMLNFLKRKVAVFDRRRWYRATVQYKRFCARSDRCIWNIRWSPFRFMLSWRRPRYLCYCKWPQECSYPDVTASAAVASPYWGIDLCSNLFVFCLCCSIVLLSRSLNKKCLTFHLSVIVKVLLKSSLPVDPTTGLTTPSIRSTTTWIISAAS